jgi:hypothetical protein
MFLKSVLTTGREKRVAAYCILGLKCFRFCPADFATLSAVAAMISNRVAVLRQRSSIDQHATASSQ